MEEKASSSIPASEAYADGNVLQITPASTNPLFTERKLWNVARVCGRDDQQGLVAADYIAKNFKGKAIGPVYTPLTQLDFAPEIARIRAEKPEAVFAFLVLVGAFAEQFAQGGDGVVLIVKRIAEQEQAAFGDPSVETGQRSDTIMVLHVDPAAKSSLLVSFPRDLLVNVPGHLALASQKVDFAVPSGNFGNVCAGHIARMMGLPIDKLVVATNENDVLDEFFKTGVYRVRCTVDTHETSSPSMDISKASNFERFVFDLLGRDATRTRELFRTELDRTGAITVTPAEFERIAIWPASAIPSPDERLKATSKSFAWPADALRAGHQECEFADAGLGVVERVDHRCVIVDLTGGEKLLQRANTGRPVKKAVGHLDQPVHLPRKRRGAAERRRVHHLHEDGRAPAFGRIGAAESCEPAGQSFHEQRERVALVPALESSQRQERARVEDGGEREDGRGFPFLSRAQQVQDRELAGRRRRHAERHRAGQPQANMVAYNCAKAGIEALTRTLALEGRDLGIRVNAIAPGLVDTASNIAAMKPKDLKRWTKREDMRALPCLASRLRHHRRLVRVRLPSPRIE